MLRRAALCSLLLAACDSPFFGYVPRDGGPDLPDSGERAPPECTTYTLESIEELGDVTGLVSVAFALTSTSVFVGTRDNRYYELGLNDGKRLDLDLPGFVPYDGARDPSGHIWLLGERGSENVVLELAGGGVITSTITPRLMRHFAVSKTLPVEVYALGRFSDSGDVIRYDGTAWERIYRGPAGRSEYGALHWHAHGDLYVAPSRLPEGQDYLLRLRGRESSFVAALEVIVSVAEIEGIGVLGGTQYGNIHVESPVLNTTEMIDFEGSDGHIGLFPQVGVRAIVPFASGFFYFTDAWMSQWLPGRGYCTPTAINRVHDLFEVVPIEGGFIYAGEGSGGAPSVLRIRLD